MFFAQVWEVSFWEVLHSKCEQWGESAAFAWTRQIFALLFIVGHCLILAPSSLSAACLHGPGSVRPLFPSDWFFFSIHVWLKRNQLGTYTVTSAKTTNSVYSLYIKSSKKDFLTFTSLLQCCCSSSFPLTFHQKHFPHFFQVFFPFASSTSLYFLIFEAYQNLNKTKANVASNVMRSNGCSFWCWCRLAFSSGFQFW